MMWAIRMLGISCVAVAASFFLSSWLLFPNAERRVYVEARVQVMSVEGSEVTVRLSDGQTGKAARADWMCAVGQTATASVRLGKRTGRLYTVIEADCRR